MLAPADAELVKRDSHIPGLALLLDPDLFATALGEHLSAITAEGAQARFVWYKPGMSCLASYRVGVGGKELNLYAKAHRTLSPEKLSAARERSRNDTSGLAGMVLENAAVTVDAFPSDSRLRALYDFADDKIRPQLLKTLVPDRADLWPATLQTLSYKPERRYVARLATDAGKSALIKLYREGDYFNAQRACDELESRLLLGSSGSHRVLILNWLLGHPLSTAMHAPDLDPAVLHAVGKAVASLHSRKSTGLNRRLRESQAAEALSEALVIGALRPALAERAHNLAVNLAMEFLRAPLEWRTIHRDFNPGQVLLTDEGATIFDFDLVARGDPAEDLGNFISHLERDWLYAKLAPSSLEQFKSALLTGYQATTRAALPARIRLYTAKGLLRLAAKPFRRREPNWPQRTEVLFNRAEEIQKAAVP